MDGHGVFVRYTLNSNITESVDFHCNSSKMLSLGPDNSPPSRPNLSSGFEVWKNLLYEGGIFPGCFFQWQVTPFDEPANNRDINISMSSWYEFPVQQLLRLKQDCSIRVEEWKLRIWDSQGTQMLFKLTDMKCMM